MNDDSVYDSVNECNRIYGGISKSHNVDCPNCQKDNWKTNWGVKEEYRSQYNPGEYCIFTCANCGYSYEEQS